MMAQGWPACLAGRAGRAKSTAVEFEVTGHSTTGASDYHPAISILRTPIHWRATYFRRDAACRLSRCIQRRRANPRLAQVLRSDRIAAGDALFESNRHVSPDLDSQNDGGGEKQRSDGDVDYGRDHHRQLGLRGVSPPHDAGDEGEKAEAELRDHQAEHSDCRTADGVHFRVNGDGANGSPGEDDGDDGCVNDVGPPTQTVVAEHSSENKLHIEHKNPA